MTQAVELLKQGRKKELWQMCCGFIDLKIEQFMGIQNLAGAGAGAIGAYIGGPIADSVSYVLLMTIYGAIFLLAIIPLLRVNERQMI